MQKSILQSRTYAQKCLKEMVQCAENDQANNTPGFFFIKNTNKKLYK